MKEGLLWFDNDPKRSLPEKIKRAASRYQVKFNRPPTICYLNSADIEGQVEETISGIQLKPVTNIQRHHLWIGVETEVARAA